MIIKNIKLKNIRSYEQAEINLPLGSTLLAGDIGTGKTTILLAIEFALFGLQPGQKGTSLLKNGETEGEVTLELEIDKKNIIIERRLKSSNKGINQSYTSISIDGEKQEISIKELKTKIIKLLNYPKEFATKTNLLYRFTVYTPQEEMKQIILEAPETRLDNLRHIFGIDKYKRINENSALVAGRLRELIRNYEGQLTKIEEDKIKLESRKLGLETLKKNSQEQNKVFQDLQKIRKTKEVELVGLDEKIREKQKYDQESEKTQVMLFGKNELHNSLEKEQEAIKREIQELKKTSFNEKLIMLLEEDKQILIKDKENTAKTYMEISANISSLQQKIRETQNLRSQISVLRVCPTCLQEVKQDYKIYLSSKFEDNLKDYAKQIEDTEKLKLQQSKLLDDFNEKLLQLDKKLRDLTSLKVRLKDLATKESRISNIDKQLEQIHKDTEMLEAQLKNLKETSSSFKKYELLYEAKNRELKDSRTNERDADIKLAETKKEIQLTQKIIEDIEKELQQKVKLKEKLNYIKEVEAWITSDFQELVNFTEKNIMLKIREDFSKLFNEWFNVLVPENFSSRLDESFTPILEQQEYQLDYEFLSGGERTAVALAYRLALNQIINSLMSKIKTKEIIILDEPTDGFSEMQLDKIRDVLQQLLAKQIIIVSHEPKIESFVQNIIKMKKYDGLSLIESEK